MTRQIPHPVTTLKRLPSARVATKSGCRREALQWVACAVHSSSPRREIARRYQTRAMASRVTAAWCGSSAASAVARNRSCITLDRSKYFNPLRVVAQVKGCTKEMKKELGKRPPQWRSTPCLGGNQPGNHEAKPTLAAGSRLRSRLSNILQAVKQRRVGWAERPPPDFFGDVRRKPNPRSANRRESSDAAR